MVPVAGQRLSLEAEVGDEMEVGGTQREPNDALFSWQIKTGCQPHEYAILYGILKNAHDTVWARGPDGLTQLRRVRIPARLHQRGVLAYSATPSAPSELIVRAPGGRTLLGAQAHSDRPRSPRNLRRRSRTGRFLNGPWR